MNNRLEKCISCDHSDFKFYADNVFLKLPIFICQNCKLYVTGKSQNELDSILLTYYEKDFWDIHRNMTNRNDPDNYSHGRKKLWRSQFRYLKKYLKNSSILEIGSGRGESLLEFDKLNYNVTGIEPDKKNVQNLKQILQQCKIIEATAENFQLQSKFNLIWMSHVFEHLSDPINFLKKLKRNFHENGVLFIEVPNVEKENDYRTFTRTPHAFNFSAKSLQNILIKSGYEIIQCDFFAPPKKIHGGINKLSNKFFKQDFYPYYPKIIGNKKSGEDIRIISKLKSNFDD